MGVVPPSEPIHTAQAEDRPEITATLIAAMARVLAEEADPKQINLFGSRGCGTTRGDPDVDLIVVEAELFCPRRNHVTEMARL